MFPWSTEIDLFPFLYGAVVPAVGVKRILELIEASVAGEIVLLLAVHHDARYRRLSVVWFGGLLHHDLR